MPFFQSMAVRFGVKSFLENSGVDPEAAGWIAAGASLVTAVATADIHGHIAGEAVAHGVHHATGHVVSHGTSHITSHGANHMAGHHAADLQRSGKTVLELNHDGYHVGDKVYVTHSDWKDSHWGTIESLNNNANTPSGMTDVQIKTEFRMHNHEWVSETQISKTKP